MVGTTRLDQQLYTCRAIANIGCQAVMLDIHDVSPDRRNRFKQTSQPAGLVFDGREYMQITSLTNHPALDNVSQKLQVHIAAAEQTNSSPLPEAFMLKKRSKTCGTAWLYEDFHTGKQQQNRLRDGIIRDSNNIIRVALDIPKRTLAWCFDCNSIGDGVNGKLAWNQVASSK
jgi:hypothetical protein